MLLLLLLIILFIHESSSGSSSNALMYELKQDEHDRVYDLPKDSKEITLTCSFGAKWFIPSTVPYQFKPTAGYNIENKQSSLLIRLPQTNNEHSSFRGLYQCCPSFSYQGIGTVNWFSNEPSCCPCCPWYEQDRCLFKHTGMMNDSSMLPKLRHTSSNCGSVFLYTNSVNMKPIQLDVIRDQPMLIPCPALNSTFRKDDPAFSIDYQLTPHRSSRQIWYPFNTPRDNQLTSILYFYDNRFGLCLFKSQIPRIMLFMLCNYNQINQQRTVQPIWPASSPVIAPTIHFYLQSANKVEDYTKNVVNSNTSHSQSFLNTINWFVKYSDDLITFRVKQHIKVLHLTCIGSYTQKYIVHKPVAKLCFRWKTLNHVSGTLPNLSYLRESYRSTDNSTWERTECLSTHQIFNKLPILYAFSNYHLSLSMKDRGIARHSKNNTFLVCEITTPDRMAPISQKIIQIALTGNQVSGKLFSNFDCDCIVLNTSGMSSNESSRFHVLIKNYTLNVNISFWTENEIDGQPFCRLNRSSMHQFEYTQVNLFRTRYNWKCRIWSKLTNLSQVLELSVGYGEVKSDFHLVVFKSLLESPRTIHNLKSHITREQNLRCVPSDDERNIVQSLGYNYPNNVTWFVSIDNETRNYTTFYKTFEHEFNLMPIYDASNYPQILFNKTPESWERINEISNLSKLYLNYWPEKLCVSCTSAYSIGIYSSGQEVCSMFNDFNVIQLLNNSSNHSHIEKTRKEKQLYFIITINNSSKSYEINLQFNNSQIFLVEGASVKLECVRKLPKMPKNIELGEWPVLVDVHAHNSTDYQFIQDTLWLISGYSLKVRKTIQSNVLSTGQLKHFKCSYEDEKYLVEFHSYKQVKPTILKPTENLQTIKSFLQPIITNTSKYFDNSTDEDIELTCQAIGLPKPSLSWMRAVYSVNETLIKWEIVQLCSTDESKIDLTIINKTSIEQEIQTCTYRILRLLKSTAKSLNQSHYQCLATNTAGSTSKQIKLIYTDTTNIDLSETNKLHIITQSVILWICLIISPVLLIIIIFSIIICLYYKFNFKNQYSSDISLPNVLYKRIYDHFNSYQFKSSSLSSSSYGSCKDYKSMEQILIELLGLSSDTTNDTTDINNITTTTTTATTTTSINTTIHEINRWIIPRKFIKTSTYPLGSGHYGSVYKAWLHCSFLNRHFDCQLSDMLLKEDSENYTVAIKASSAVQQNISYNSNLICLKNEIRILANLNNCENIVKMIGIMLESRVKWRNMHNSLEGISLILECCMHKSLATFIRSNSHHIMDSLMNYEETHVIASSVTDNLTTTVDAKEAVDSKHYRLTVRELYRFAYGIISGVVYLVKNSVIHRDLATRNILVNHNYIPKISDFGLAVQLTPLNGITKGDIYNIDGEFDEDQLTNEYYRVLTPRKKLPLRILPPEALLQHKFYFSSDVWQYGLLLWELFHLERYEPFQGIRTFQEL
ncbi:unnamed protein product, partial [Heterobilharzia americana]